MTEAAKAFRNRKKKRLKETHLTRYLLTSCKDKIIWEEKTSKILLEIVTLIVEMLSNMYYKPMGIVGSRYFL